MASDISSINTSINPEAENMPIDRRQVRIHCQTNVQFRHGNINDYGVCWNLGPHGMYIAFDGEITQGECIELSFFISNEYPSLIEAIGKVVWVNIRSNDIQNNSPEGFGVEFITISESSVSSIQQFIDLY